MSDGSVPVSPRDDIGPTALPERLVARADWIARLRAWFRDEGFVEVETPTLSWDTVVDRHLDPIPVPVAGIMPGHPPGATMFLQTSPEFAMKRLLSLELPAIFQIGRAFRAGERGDRHNVEFTMAEWYRVGDDYRAGIDRLSRLTEAMFPRVGSTESERKVRVVSYRDLFVEAAGVDPFEPRFYDDPAARRQLPDDSLCRLWDRGVLEGRTANREPDRQFLLELLFEARVVPYLTSQGAAIVVDYPGDQSALAIATERDYGTVAERFELFVDGIELANGYHELRDAAELARRNRRVNAERAADGKPPLPETSRLLEALPRMPSCAGVALGVDRAVMVALGAQTIDQVWAFPWERA